MSEVKFKLAAGTNVGLIRTNNEDNFVVCPDLSTSQWLIPQGGDYAPLGELGALLVVADGMGGANAGEVASEIAVHTIQSLFTPSAVKPLVGDDKGIQTFMADVVKRADLKILERSKADAAARGMGTTVVMAWLLGRRAYVCWCGDSRCYALNDRSGIIQLSKDHSYVQELVDKGELDPAFMHDHPLSNVITRCLGDLDKRALPDTRVYELHDGDTIMLCSDGLSGLVSDDDIARLIADYGDEPMECKDELISVALNNGGHDNVTVALCTVLMGDVTKRSATKRSRRADAIEESKELRNTIVPGQKENKKKNKEQGKPSKAKAENVEKAGEGKAGEITEKEEKTSRKDEEDKGNNVATEAPQDIADDKADDKDSEKSDVESENKGGKKSDGKADAKDTDKADDNDDKADDEDSDEDGISSTAKTFEKKAATKKKFLLPLLIVLLAAALCIYLLPECEPIRQSIVSIFTNTPEK